MASTDPWWLIDATSGSPSQWVITQYSVKPQPADTAFTVTGPYTSQAAAQAAVPKGAKSSVQSWNSGLQAVTSGANQVNSPGSTGTANPLAVFSSIQNALSAFYDKLTDGKMWRSLGWLLLGIALMIMGLVLWIGPSAARQSPIGLARRALG